MEPNLALVVTRPLSGVGGDGSETLDSVVRGSGGWGSSIESLVHNPVVSSTEEFCEMETTLVNEMAGELGNLRVGHGAE
jgi:hypothetical protein